MIKAKKRAEKCNGKLKHFTNRIEEERSGKRRKQNETEMIKVKIERKGRKKIEMR